MKTFCATLALVALAFAIAVPAQATISIMSQTQGFLGSDKSQVTTTHNGATVVNFDATGVDKLVVAIGTESGFNNQAVTSLNLAFNGVPMTLAAFDNTHQGGFDGGIGAIFYLDNPFQGPANFTVGATTTGGGLNGGLVSIFGLQGTLPGIGAAEATHHTQQSAGPVSTSLTTTGNDSLVIAMVQNSGTNNAAGTPSALAPLTQVHSGFWGNQWGSVASGFQEVAAAGTTVTPTFQTNAGGNIRVVGVEFLAIPEPSKAMLMGLGTLLLAARRCRSAH